MEPQIHADQRRFSGAAFFCGEKSVTKFIFLQISSKQGFKGLAGHDRMGPDKPGV
jgi:hypothetical protein